MRSLEGLAVPSVRGEGHPVEGQCAHVREVRNREKARFRPQDKGSQSLGHTFRGRDEQFKGVWRLRSSWWDLRDTGKEVMSLRSPESRMGTAEAQILTWEAGRKGLWPSTCAALSCFPPPSCPEQNQGACGFRRPSFAFQGSWHPLRASQ